MPWAPSPNVEVVERWRRRLDAQAASGLTVPEFCRKAGFSPGSLYRWRSWLRREADAPKQLPALVEVRVAADEAMPGSSAMVVELHSGRRVHVEPGFDDDAVLRLVHLLELG